MSGDVCAVNHGGNAESVQAFKGIAPKLKGLRLKVLEYICYAGMATAKDVVGRTGLQRLTVGARLTELKQAGYIAPSGYVKDGCRVFVLTDAGRLAL